MASPEQRKPGRPPTGHDPARSIRVSDALWRLYGRIVGNRSEDLRAYVEWRTEHPDTPLPKRRRRSKAARDSSSTEEETRG